MKMLSRHADTSGSRNFSSFNAPAMLVLLLLSAATSVAQVDFPELSPVGILQQTVGHTEFEIRYGRPAARKRKIMGDLVPYKRLWRTGAGKCSTISFSRMVVINGKRVPAGVYAMVSIPDEQEWVIMLNSDTTRIYGDPSEYDPANEVVRLSAKPEKTSRFYESFTIDVDVVRYDAVVYLSWEHTQVRFPVATLSHEKTLADINLALKGKRDPTLLAQASYYYTMNNEDPEQVLRWLDEAIALGGDRWVYHQKVDLLDQLKRYNPARKAAGDAIAFLQRTQPVEWEGEIEILKEKIQRWPKE